MTGSKTPVSFGLFELTGGELRREGRVVQLQEQPLKLLELLLERPGETVSRETIREHLWPPDVHVEFEPALNAAVRRLREALGDSASSPRFVATVPKQGYRFIAPVSRAKAPRRWVPWAAVAVVVLGLSAWFWSFRDTGPVRLAVLPFENLSGDPERDYISEGLTEELIDQLSVVSPGDLHVIARTSVENYEGTDVNVGHVGAELDVEYVLEGSVRVHEDALRISTRLVRVDGQANVWSDSFDRPFEKLLDTERAIAREVAESLAAELVTSPPPRPVPSGDAYARYLEGRYLLNQRTADGFERAVAAFEAARGLDPHYAAAYRGLAESFALAGNYDWIAPKQAYPKAREHTEKALELDPDAAEAHLLLAFLQHGYEWRHDAAERSFRRALELNPNLARAYLWRGGFLSSRGRHDEALASTRRALELDPLSLVVRAELAWQLYYARRYDEAAAECRAILELEPEFLPAEDNLKWILISAGRDEEAFESFVRVMALEGESSASVTEARSVFARGGLTDVLRWSLDAPEERITQPGQSAFNVAIDYAAIGDIHSALDWLERAYDDRETDLVNVDVDPRLDPLRGDARFAALTR